MQPRLAGKDANLLCFVPNAFSNANNLRPLTVCFPSHSVPTIGQGAPEQDMAIGCYELKCMRENHELQNDTSTVFGQFLLDFGMQFCVASAVFGEVGG